MYYDDAKIYKFSSTLQYKVLKFPKYLRFYQKTVHKEHNLNDAGHGFDEWKYGI